MTLWAQWIWAWGAIGVLRANNFGPAAPDAGDVARALHRLSDEDWFDLQLLSDWPALGALGAVEPGPAVSLRPRRPGVFPAWSLFARGHIGDVAASVDSDVFSGDEVRMALLMAKLLTWRRAS